MKKLSKQEEIEKLKQVLIEKVKSENDSRYANLSSDEIMKIIIESSNKGKYVFWVLREYLKGNIQRFEDMGRVKQALILFRNNLSKFTEQQKQLNKLSFQELESLVEPYQEVLTQNEIKRVNKEKIWSEIDVIYEGVKGKIYIPKTKEASIFLGQGTRWCTAAANSTNMFDYYNRDGELYVFVLNKKDEKGREIKYQLHWQTSQFMDMNDYESNLIDFDKKTNLIDILFENLSVERKIKTLFESNWFLKFFYEKEKNPEVIEKTGKFLLELGFFDNISDKYKTEELCKLAIMQSPLNFIYVPKKYKTREFYEMAFSLSGSLIGSGSVPEEFLTQEICEKVVKESGFLIKYVPDKFKTEKLIRMAIQHNGNAIFVIPKEFITHELCELAVLQNGISLKYIPQEFKTDKLCKLAVECCGCALSFVPKKFKTKELCELAVGNSEETLAYVPEELLTQELCELAVRQNGMSLEYVLFKTKELCDIAVKQNGMSLEYVPHELKTEELCKIAVQQNGKALSCVPHAFKTRELCELAVRQNGRALVNVPSKFESKELCEIAVRQNGRFLSSVSAHMMDHELCEIAIRQDGKNLFSVDYELKTKELCMIAVNQNKNALQYVPKEFLNDELLKKIVFDFIKENNLNFSFEESIEMMFNINKNIISESFEEIKGFYKKYYIDIISKKISDIIQNNPDVVGMKN